MGEREIIEYGFDEDTVKRVLNMVKKAEFKRRQSPPGNKDFTCISWKRLEISNNK